MSPSGHRVGAARGRGIAAASVDEITRLPRLIFGVEHCFDSPLPTDPQREGKETR